MTAQDVPDRTGRVRRVCIMTETFHPVRGGGETQARSLAAGLARSGWQVLVLTRRSDRGLARDDAIGSVRVRRIPPSGPSRWKKWGLVITGFWALIRYRREYDALIVSGFRLLGIPAVTVSRMLGKACILKADSLGEMSGDYFRAGLRQVGLQPSSGAFQAALSARNRLFLSADGFVAISSDVAAELAEAGVPPHRIVRIPNSVDVARFRPADPETKARARASLGLPGTGLVTVYTGRLVSYKGLPLLLRVWRRLRDDGDVGLLVLVGGGGLDMHDCEDALRRYVMESHLDDAVVFAGEVEDVRPHLSAADILVFPSENEAFGISVIEAMAAGLPVACSDAGGLVDIVIPEQTGLQFRAGDGAGLARCLSRLHRDGRIRAALGRAARERAMAEYSEERVVDRYETLLVDGFARGEG